MNFELSQSELESLLDGFLVGALGLELKTRIMDLKDLPEGCRTRLQRAEAKSRAWTAWVTDDGPVAAWAEYDIAASRRLNAAVLFIEWAGTHGHHALWCHCTPNRPTEWIIGRGPLE